MLVAIFLYYLTIGWAKKHSSEKITISPKYANIFVNIFTKFNRQLNTNLLISAVFTWHTPNWRKRKLQQRILQLYTRLYKKNWFYVRHNREEGVSEPGSVVVLFQCFIGDTVRRGKAVSVMTETFCGRQSWTLFYYYLCLRQVVTYAGAGNGWVTTCERTSPLTSLYVLLPLLKVGERVAA